MASHGDGHVERSHYAFAGAAGLLAIALVVLVARLRERDVARIMAEVATAPAAA